MKYGDGISEYFGDLSNWSLFVFYKLQGVLLLEFGDLIPRIWDQKIADLKTDSEREMRSLRDSSSGSEVARRMSSADELKVLQKIEAAEGHRGSLRDTQVRSTCVLTAIRQICQN